MKPIVIIGGGIAGLYTAFVLSKKGLPIVVFEKEESLGGRMYTEEIRPTKNKKFLIEGGAGVIRKDEELIIDLCKELHIKLNFWHSETAIVLNDGEQSEILDYDYPKLLSTICSESDSNKSFQYIVKNSELETKEKIGILIGTTYSELFGANSVHVCQENDFNEFLLEDKKVEYGKPVEGWKALVKALKNRIKEYNGLIYTETPLKEIGSNYVVVKQKGETKTKVEFSELIVTCPLHFIPSLKLTSALNEWYLLVNKMIEETDYLRVYSYFDRPLKITKKIATNLPLQRVIPINEQLIMTVYNDGSYAKKIAKMEKEPKKLSSYIREQLELLLERQIPKIKKNWVIFWNKGIASWKPSKTSPQEVLPTIQHPVDNIYFCGDTYSLHPGWIEGAMESSNDVLDLIFDKYNL